MAKTPWWRRMLPRIRWTRRRVVSSAVVVLLIVGLVGVAAWPERASYRTEQHRIIVQTGPAGDQQVDLDATFYVPRSASRSSPVPAVLLAHGFGGTKNSVADDASDLADLGYCGAGLDRAGLRALHRRDPPQQP